MSVSSSRGLSYSFVAKKADTKPVLQLLQTTAPAQTDDDKADSALEFQVVKSSLTANNKFYWAFGERSPFNFFKCYPVDASSSQLVEKDDDGNNQPLSTDYVHPVVWGIAEVTQSTLPEAPKGTRYLAMLPVGESASFAGGGHVDPNDGGKLIVHRTDTHPAYNEFRKIEDDDALASADLQDLALVCSPGIVTGFGLYYRMLNTNSYGGVENIVLTSASSKVALAMATFVKKKDPDGNFASTKIIGYTSKGNKEFCEKTGLYDQVLVYDELLGSKDDGSNEKKKYIMIDIAGRGDIYNLNERQNPKADIVKLLCIGNSSDTADNQSTFAFFSIYATIKLILSMMGAPAWIRNRMNPVQELYLIMDDMALLTSEWGPEKVKAKTKEFGRDFCKEAKKWMKVRSCNNEESIGKAFSDIIEGSVPPSEAIVLDVKKAVAHRK